MVKPVHEQTKIIFEQEILDHMQQFVKGQNSILDLMSYVGHMYTVKLSALAMGYDRQDLPKLNALITGPTGFGKTFMIKKLAEALGLPYTRIDCSTVSAEGWKGMNLSSKIAEFCKASQFGAGILHLDEFDKMGNNTGDSGDQPRDHKLSLQQNMLDLLDGEYSHGEEDGRTPLKNVNNALVILSGSFQSARNTNKNKINIGFSTSNKEDLEVRKSWKEHLTDSGFMHEFASRIVCSAELERYDADQIKDIVLNGRQSGYTKYTRVLAHEAILTEEELDELVTKISESKNGMRDMDSLLFEKYYNRKSGN